MQSLFLSSAERPMLESRRIRKEVLELSAKHPRYGYRRITALMRRDGFEVNGKRVARIRREEGIKVSKKQRRMKRLGISTAQRQQAERPGQVEADKLKFRNRRTYQDLIFSGLGFEFAGEDLHPAGAGRHGSVRRCRHFCRGWSGLAHEKLGIL